jgi:hypothetical protein
MARKPKDEISVKNTKKQKVIKTTEKKEETQSCKYCKAKIEEGNFFLIYNLAVATDKEMRFIGLQKLMDELANYAMKKGYHISASQIILLRPDVVKEFLSLKYKGERIIFFYLSEYECCYTCFGHYSECVPLI